METDERNGSKLLEQGKNQKDVVTETQSIEQRMVAGEWVVQMKISQGKGLWDRVH
jgi:hypothetical protein